MNSRAHRKQILVAPMMDHTDRHCRYFHRLLAPSARLYTEMVTAEALLRGDAARLLAFSPEEHPVALQLGGSDPARLAAAARMAEEAGYDEINLNVGCPSDRVRSGRFGACLMREPELVAECVARMRRAVGVAVTVKTRIGLDGDDDYEFLQRFVATVAAAGCREFTLHARIAVLGGLSPAENRCVPPLDYERVYRLKSDFPALTVVLNGGVDSVAAARAALARVDGVMLGRAAYRNPWLLAQLEGAVFGPRRTPGSRRDVVLEMIEYARREQARGVRLHAVVRHMLGLYAGQPGARRWRRRLSEGTAGERGDSRLLEDSLEWLEAA